MFFCVYSSENFLFSLELLSSVCVFPFHFFIIYHNTFNLGGLITLNFYSIIQTEIISMSHVNILISDRLICDTKTDMKYHIREK